MKGISPQKLLLKNLAVDDRTPAGPRKSFFSSPLKERLLSIQGQNLPQAKKRGFPKRKNVRARAYHERSEKVSIHGYYCSIFP
jgi:hypothetical protein